MAIELENSFTVPVAPEQAWDVLLDVERIAPCMPGASVLSLSDDGNEIKGQVKVKLGSLSLTYKGTAKFTDKDEQSLTLAIEASGKETRSAGTASANVQAALKPADEAGSTLVSIHTSLNVTGRPAQFGRSLLPEVSGKLIAQFAANLEALIASGNATDGPAPAGETGEVAADETVASTSGAAGPLNEAAPAAAEPVPAPTPAPAPTPQQEESLNAIKLVVVPVLKRIAPVLAVGAVGAGIVIAARRLSGKRSS
jgi:carbon monoxide dehydrogenase subunit G